MVPAEAAVGRVEAPTAPPREAVPIGPPQAGEDLGAWARRMAEERARARGRRDFKAADEARRLLAEHGFEVRDTKDGAVELRPLAAKPRPA